ncbi:MAG: hypothetical protein ACPHO6_12965, partial [Candidatus Latescibacterota bacterium]
MDRTKDKIREKALALGFTLFGVTTVDPLQGAGFYAEWIERGYAGTMDYLKRNVDKRGDVRALVPGAQSVLCLGMEYWQPTPEVEDDGVREVSWRQVP